MLKERRSVRFLSAEELGRVFAAIRDPEFPNFCLVSAYTGLRSGEIIRLAWRDIDNPEGFLRISAAQKNKTESRIPLNSATREILDRARKRRGIKPFRYCNINRIGALFKRAVRSAGLESPRFHDLRHTFASHLAMSGEHLKAIQGLMRHEDISSTLVYAHLSPAHLREASERLSYGPLPLPKKRK